MQTYNTKRNLSACQCFFHFKRWYFLGSALLCLSSLSLSAQSVSSASIDEDSTNRLTVTFSENITVSDASGFRLVGGVARIERLLSGSGSNTLTFVLTDHVLPDDAFRLLHWPEMSDARGSSGKLGEIDQPVTKNVSSYKGNGKVYYVSTSGNNNNIGTSKGSPLRTVGAAEAKASSGDFILLKRGDVWDNANVKITKSGTVDNYLTIGAYGSGNKPIIYSKGLGTIYRNHRVQGATFAVHGADYVQIDNIHVKTDISVGGGDSNDGIQLLDCRYAVVSNCVAEAPTKGGYFGIRVNTWVDTNPVVGVTKEEALFNNTYPVVLNSEVFGYQANVGTQIWPYDGRHTIFEGGLIENCISRDPKNPALGGDVWESLMINRGEFNGFVIRKNKIYNYFVSGIETFGSKNVVVEYNEIFDPLNYASGGKAIKAGGYNSASQTAPGVGELFSDNITVRYNKIYNIIQGGSSPPNTNGIDGTGTRSGKIYGNLIYNVLGIGIKVTGQPNEQGWDVFNNTVLDCGLDAIQVYNPDGGSYAGNIRLSNNILQGDVNDIQVLISNSTQKVTGANNILINNDAIGAYESTTDFQASFSALFVDASNNNYRLKSGASAINAGTTNTPFYPRDIQGFLIQGNRDIGAYEFGGQSGPIDPEPTQGVYYAYYEGDWPNLPNFNSLTAIKTGRLPNFSLSPAEREDYYGFVQSAFLDIAQAGEYTFYVNSDDGAKLYVNGNLVVDNDGRHVLRERFGTINLPSGEHRLRVEYFEAFSTQALEVRYSSSDIGISKQLIPNSVMRPDDGTTPADENGVSYSYYGGDWSQLPDFSSLTPIKTGTLPNFSLSPAQVEDYYGFVYTTYLEVSATGNYTFYTNSDDGSKLYINDQQVVNNDGLRPLQERSGSVTLAKGRHKLVVEYFEGYGGQTLEVRYKGSGISKQLIPDDVLFLKGGNTPPNPIVTADAGSDRTVSLGSTVQLYGRGIGPNPFRGYLWEKVSGPSLTLSARGANATLTNLQVGTYVMRFTATDSEGNSGSDEMTLTVTGNNARTASTTKAHPAAEKLSEFAHSTLSAYPNPANTDITVNLPTSDQDPGVLTLTDVSGKVVHRQVVSGTESVSSLSIPTDQLTGGMYLLRWQQQNNQQTFKLSVNH